MGVVNVTPDSFSDGGRFLDRDAAIAHGLVLFSQGADVVDVGGESTRPGAEPVDEAEELARVVPVVQELARHGRVSVDTRKPAVAAAAVEAGATLVNDVSASAEVWQVAADATAAAERGVGYVAMHMKGDPRTMQRDPAYDDVVREVRDFLVERATAASDAGVREVWIDPGIGFGKTDEHNLSLLKHLGAIVDTGFPVVVGTSRKRFLQQLIGAGSNDVLEGTIATCVAAMHSGARMVRVHDVRPAVEASRVNG